METWKSAISPIEDACCSRTPVDALTVFPLEVWSHIFDGLDKSEDFWSVMNVCSDFRKLLEPKKNARLFGEVLKISVRFLSKSQMLKCRLVCKDWKTQVDRLYQDCNGNGFAKAYDAVGPFQNLLNPFTADNSIQSFLADTSHYSKNPFPGRQLVLNWKSSEQHMGEEFDRRLCIQFWSSAHQLLQRFGRHVFFATIILDDSEDELRPSELEEVLHHSLICLPNARKLTLRNGSLISDSEISKFYSTKTLPRFAELETLELWYRPKAFNSLIMNSCCTQENIKHLRIMNAESSIHLSQNINFANLRSLCADLFLEDLAGFQNWNRILPLKYIKLNLNAIVDVKRVFQTLQMCALTLEFASISFYGKSAQTSLKAFSLFRVNLPKLQTLQVFKYNGPLDIFLDLNSLHELVVECEKTRICRRGLIEYVGFEERMHESNLWKLMPCLKTFELIIQNTNRLFAKKFTRPSITG